MFVTVLTLLPDPVVSDRASLQELIRIFEGEKFLVLSIFNRGDKPMTDEEKRHQVAVGSLLRSRRNSKGYTVKAVVKHCRGLGWSDLTAEKLNRWERGVTGHEITGLKTLMALYGISCKEIAEVK